MTYSKAPLLWLVPFVAAMIAALSGCGGAQTRYTSHMERGQQYLAQGNLDKASVEFRNALQIRPKGAEALYLNGEVAERHGNTRAAASYYQAAIDVDAEYVAPRASLGRLYVFAGSSDRALKLIETSLAKHPDDPDLLTVRAAARMQMKNTAGAQTDAERAVKIAPTNENAIALLAAIYRQSGDYEHAISVIRSGLKQIPKSIDLRQVLANLYVTAGQPEKSEEPLRELVDLRPEDLNQRYQLALFFVRQHRIDDAQQILSAAVKSQPKSDEAKLALVTFVTSQRSHAEGEKMLREFIQREPDNFGLRLELGALLQRNGATPEALRAYADVIERDGTGPNGLAARNRIAAIHTAQGHYDVAQKLIGEVLAKNPRDSDALILRGDIELNRNDPAGAISDLRAVLRDQPGAIPVRRALARAYLANGEPALAEEELRAASEAAADVPALRVELAQVLAQTQRIDAAVTMLEETVRRAPNDPGAREALVRVYLQKGDLRSARVAAEDLQTLRPDSSVGFYLAGLVAQNENRLEDSQKSFEHALELQPRAIDVLTSLARLELARGRGAQAVARVEEAVKADPDNALPLNLLGELYIATKDFPRSVSTLTRATNFAPHWWPPYRSLALAKIAQNDSKGAIAAYEAGIKIAPAEPQLVVEAASLDEQEGRVDTAIARYEALYKRSPRLVLAANNLAMLLVTYKHDQRSLDRARDLTAGFTASNNSNLLDTSGWVHFKRGEYSDALPVLERATEQAPESKVIHFHLGMAELQSGQRARARSNLETALSGGAKFAGSDEARKALASLTDRAG